MTNQPLDAVAPIRVLVVDDSAFMRFTITKHLNETPGITVVGAARDGREALDLIPQLNPDVITLDVEMPRLDGISTLREIMAQFPRPVVMLSSLTSEGTVETVQALTLGAVDFVAKPAFKANINSVLEEVVEKVFKASKARVWSSNRQLAKTAPIIKLPTSENKAKPRPLSRQEKIVVIGSSTGGPRALNTVIPYLPEKLPAAVVVIQHMPAGFTRSLAERLDSASRLKVKEAEPGDTLEVGRVLMAPGGFHTVFDNQGIVTLNQNPPVHGVRPAIDVTLVSIAQLFGSRVVGVILTGMGNDGTNGAGLVHGVGGWVIAEAEETCVVWGMPRSVTEAGFVNQVVPLQDVAQAIVKAVES
jgi:two-component system, chemotaxis family, protein-glutamate methylesterase/glutaminase